MEPSFFGETVSVPSRIFDQEEDDDVISPPLKNYEIALDSNPSKVVFAVDKLSKAFCQVYLMSAASNDEPVGHVYETDEGSDEKRVERIRFYKAEEPKTLLAFSHGSGDPFMINTFAKTFLRRLPESTEIFLLKNDHLSFHKSPEPLEVSVMTRILSSSTFDYKAIKVPRLQEPNIVSGLPAALLTYSEYLERKCLLILSFTDTFEPDSISLSGFLPLLKLLETPLDQDLIARRLKSLAFQIQTDQIYM